MNSFEKKIQDLGPWMYEYTNSEGLKIESGYDHDFYKNKNDIMQKFFKPEISNIVDTLFKDKNISGMRAIDLGCLEGHFSDILCQKNFKEVVSVDLSKKFIKKANFLLKGFKSYRNSTIIQSNILDLENMKKIGKFNLIVAKGIFYHLKNPLLLFDLFELLKPQENEPFYILLDTQYKTNNLNFLINDIGVSQYKASSSIEVDEFNRTYNIKKSNDTYEVNMGAVFDSVRQISNPKSLYFLISKYFYKQIISYNIANYSAVDFNSKFILSKSVDSNLINNLNKMSINNYAYFQNWDGKGVAGIDFKKLWYYKILNSKIFQRLNYYVINFYLTSLQVSLTKNAPKEILEFKLKALTEGAKRNNSIFEKFKYYYFSRTVKKALKKYKV